MVIRGTFKTDPISALLLPPPVSIGRDATVGAALQAVQRHAKGYVLIVENEKPVGIMSEREVLMKIVARDVKYDSNVASFASPNPYTLRETDRIGEAVQLMSDTSADNIPIIDKAGRALAVLRTVDIIHFLAEVFPEQALNLPPRPDQVHAKPEGA